MAAPRTTAAQAAALLGVSVRTIQFWCANGTIPSCRVGRRVLLPPAAELVAWLERRTSGGGAEPKNVTRMSDAMEARYALIEVRRRKRAPGAGDVPQTTKKAAALG